MPRSTEGRRWVAPAALLLATEEAAFYVDATLNPNGGDIMV